MTLPGFYDEVRDLSPEIRRQWAALSFDERKFLEKVGLKRSAGEEGFTVLEQIWAGPPPRSTASSAAIPGPAPRPSSPRRPRPSFPSGSSPIKIGPHPRELPAFAVCAPSEGASCPSARSTARALPSTSPRATASSAPPARRSRTSGTKPQSCSARADRSRSSATPESARDGQPDDRLRAR